MFDAVGARRVRVGGKKLLAGPLSALIHLALVGGVVGASYWAVGETPEPPLPPGTIIYRVSLVPAGGGGGGGRPREVKAPPPRRNVIEAPATIPDRPPEVTPPDQSNVSDTDVGPIERNLGIPGLPPGPGIGDNPPGPGDGPGPAPIPIGGNVVAPLLLHRVEPVYPEAARKARIQGVVLLEAIIGFEGYVQDIRVIKSVHPLLDDAASRSVRQWRYRPATLNGRDVRVYLTAMVDFRLY